MISFKITSIYPFVILLLVLVSGSVSCQAGDMLFPEYTVLKPNVTFWKKVYSEYSYDQSVIHDKSDPLRIYRVLRFEDSPTAGAMRARRRKERDECRRYRTMLLHLASGSSPSTSEEKRILSMFGSGSRSELRRAAENIRCQRGQKDRFLQGVIRSGAFLEAMRHIFRQYGLPEDLCYLPHVESSFNVRARSKCGAAGMWQFMRGTGRRFLKIDYLIDERLDPFESTRAAAELLLENYQRLGSWPLAITAYNHGTAGMERAFTRHGSFEKIISDYRGRRFKFASRNFYAEFLAAREIAERYRQNAEGVVQDAPVETVAVEMPGYVSFLELASLLDMSPGELEMLNPALRRPVISGEKYIPAGYKIRLPLLDSSAFALAMAAGRRPVFLSSQRPSKFYQVRRGDTAHRIARRHGISLKKLALINSFDSRYTVYAGQYLRLPF